MKNLNWTVILLILLGTSCGTSNSKTESQSGGQVINLNAKQFSDQSTSGKIIDVRTAQEIAQGKIEGSTVMDYYQRDFKEKVLKLSKDEPIFIYCAVGARSREAAEMLVSEGYTKVYHLQGGIQAWYQQGLPLSR